MYQLIKADLYHVSRTKAFYITLLCALSVTLFFTLTTAIDDRMMFIQSLMINGTVLLPMLFIPIFMLVWQKDFVSRTVNSVLISGISREKYYFSKLATTYLLGTLLVVVYNVSTLIFSLGIQGSIHFLEILGILGLQTILYLVVLAIGLFLYSLENSAALSTAVYVLIILLGENVVTIFLEQLGADAQKISQYFLFKNLGAVVQLNEMSQDQLVKVFVGALLLLIVAMTCTVTMLQRKELK
ncbi:ABC transporter permease [Enterococcus sp. BWB1-3]|uniref:ABC transporter permease n=1 Tax=unclassified Enterococcus TaxID=2608891 RepID=UPI001922AAF2|nr:MULTISPECIES: ABC transporter permease [unclassified Enterococcus]MBL1227832.1 ABC transporter permease [Enterococcus sp. BWB1-3]MCB5953377.1 ABC transporter permease [Enterococcus sp. BWT-B8]